jgi:hypothetical protein
MGSDRLTQKHEGLYNGWPDAEDLLISRSVDEDST